MSARTPLSISNSVSSPTARPEDGKVGAGPLLGGVAARLTALRREVVADEVLRSLVRRFETGAYETPASKRQTNWRSTDHRSCLQRLVGYREGGYSFHAHMIGPLVANVADPTAARAQLEAWVARRSHTPVDAFLTDALLKAACERLRAVAASLTRPFSPEDVWRAVSAACVADDLLASTTVAAVECSLHRVREDGLAAAHPQRKCIYDSAVDHAVVEHQLCELALDRMDWQASQEDVPPGRFLLVHCKAKDSALQVRLPCRVDVDESRSNGSASYRGDLGTLFPELYVGAQASCPNPGRRLLLCEEALPAYRRLVADLATAGPLCVRQTDPFPPPSPRARLVALVNPTTIADGRVATTWSSDFAAALACTPPDERDALWGLLHGELFLSRVHGVEDDSCNGLYVDAVHVHTSVITTLNRNIDIHRGTRPHTLDRLSYVEMMAEHHRAQCERLRVLSAGPFPVVAAPLVPATWSAHVDALADALPTGFVAALLPLVLEYTARVSAGPATDIGAMLQLQWSPAPNTDYYFNTAVAVAC